MVTLLSFKAFKKSLYDLVNNLCSLPPTIFITFCPTDGGPHVQGKHYYVICNEGKMLSKYPSMMLCFNTMRNLYNEASPRKQKYPPYAKSKLLQ